MSVSHDPCALSLAEASALVRERSLSPVRYVKALLERIAKVDPAINAFLRLTPEIALEQARLAEAEIARGGWRGPLHGVPYALKDIVDYAGLPTTAHSAILRDSVAQGDAEVTRRLREAGAVFMGKLSTHEFAIGGPCFDLPWPPARNPWNRDHFCGGSSSGSGAAVAAGLVPMAIGTDTGGSIRNPATMCGVVGLKPTYGRVSRRGVLPLAWSLDHVGPLTRTVRDAAMSLDAIAGWDPRDPGSADRAAAPAASLLGRGVRGLRVGVLRHFYREDMAADDEVSASIEQAVELLAAEGARICEVRTEPLQRYAAVNRVILTSEAWSVHARWLRERPQDYGALTRERLMPGAFFSAGEYIDALRMRTKMAAAFNALFEEVDVVVTASAHDPACRIDDPAEVERTYGRQARAPFNLTGNPALAMPTGFSKAGLPLGLQVVGRAFDEATVCRVGDALESALALPRRLADPVAS